MRHVRSPNTASETRTKIEVKNDIPLSLSFIADTIKCLRESVCMFGNQLYTISQFVPFNYHVMRPSKHKFSLSIHRMTATNDVLSGLSKRQFVFAFT